MCNGIFSMKKMRLKNTEPGLLVTYQCWYTRSEAPTLMESMTRMFPTTVTRLRDPATRMMITISTVVYGLSAKMLVLLPLVLVLWDEFWVSMPGGSWFLDFLLTDASGSNHICTLETKRQQKKWSSTHPELALLFRSSSVLVCKCVRHHSCRCKVMCNCWCVYRWQVFERFGADGLAPTWKTDRWANTGCNSSAPLSPISNNMIKLLWCVNTEGPNAPYIIHCSF